MSSKLFLPLATLAFLANTAFAGASNTPPAFSAPLGTLPATTALAIKQMEPSLALSQECALQSAIGQLSSFPGHRRQVSLGTSPSEFGPAQSETRSPYKTIAAFETEGGPFPGTVPAACYPPLSLATTSLPAATAGSNYSVSLTANGGQPPYIWSFGLSSLPQSFSISSSGDLTGIPADAGIYVFNVVVSDSLKTNVTGVLTLAVTATPTPTPSPSTVIVVVPTSVSVATGTTQQFAASVTGTSNTAVTWSVSGTGCRGAACGTISSSGLYTAPAAVPSSATVTITATSVSDPKQSASGAITIVRPAGTTYYLAPASAGGNDSHNGLSASAPWLTPNHAVNCGDVILAASGNYSASNFEHTFGTVTCPAGNNVAWLKCATFDTCKISASGSYTNGMTVSADYWGVQGWEVTTTQDTNACFLAWPSSGVTIHHIIFANDIANGCYSDGFTGGYNGDASVDYLVVIGSIAYNAAQTSLYCDSGITVGEAVESDSLPGTHIYFAGNFSWGNFDANPCEGGPPTDGNGIIVDTLDGSQVGYTTPYAAQVVVDNNILVANGGRGLNVFDNSAGSQHAAVYLRHNTLWGNNRDTNETNGLYCGESQINNALNVQEFDDLAVTDAATGCSGIALYDYAVHEVNGTDHVYDDWGWSATGTYTSVTAPSTGFSFGSGNTMGTDPVLFNPVVPSAPNCSGYSSVPACMAAVIADFKPTNPAAAGYGYQIPSSTPVYDPLFPQWLCNVTNLPPGLVTMGCLTG